MHGSTSAALVGISYIACTCMWNKSFKPLKKLLTSFLDAVLSVMLTYYQQVFVLDHILGAVGRA